MRVRDHIAVIRAISSFAPNLETIESSPGGIQVRCGRRGLALERIVLSSEETSPAHRICGKCSVLESGNDAECVAFLRDEMLERQRNGQKPLWGISEVRH